MLKPPWVKGQKQSVEVPPPPSALGTKPQPGTTELPGATPKVEPKGYGATALPQGEGVMPGVLPIVATATTRRNHFVKRGKEWYADIYQEQAGWTERRVTDPSKKLFLEKIKMPLSQGEGVNPVGDFGPVFTEFKGRPKEAIERLLRVKDGEAPGALYKEGLGDIDLVWGKGGKDGYGLAHILEKRGEKIINSLPDIIKSGKVSYPESAPNKAFIETPDHRAVVRLDWNRKNKNWIVTAFEFYPHLKADRTADVTSPKGSPTTIPELQGGDKTLSKTIPPPTEPVKPPVIEAEALTEARGTITGASLYKKLTEVERKLSGEEPPTSPPSTTADVGGYAKTPLKGMELPEIVELAKEINEGKYPQVKERLRAFRGQALGQFSPTGIKLRADIFKDPPRAHLRHDAPPF